MKKILFLSFILFALISCKKEEPEVAPATFADIQLKHIQAVESTMSPDNISISDAKGVIWKTGDVFLYKTNEGRYGKFEVVAVAPTNNYQLTLKAVTFGADGKVYNQSDALIVKGTWSGDLDLVKELGSADSPTIADFKNDRITLTSTIFKPENNAKFIKYNFLK